MEMIDICTGVCVLCMKYELLWYFSVTFSREFINTK